jgi:recombination protein RecT
VTEPLREKNVSTTNQPKQELAIFRQIDAPDFKAQLARALPNAMTSGLSADRMVRLAITMLRRNEALQKCTPLSIMACVVEIAQLGLEPEGVLGHAYMVPFGDQCTLIVGYRGFIHLMYQSGVVTEVSSEIVRKADKFQRVLGTERQLVHVPAAIPEKDDERNWIGAYAVARFLGSATPAFEYLERVKIYQARARSRGYQKYMKDGKSTPWVTDAEEMWKKTPVRRLAKRMPTSTSDKRPQLLRAVMLDEYGERPGLLLPTLHGFDVNPDPPEPQNGVPVQLTIEVQPEDVKKSEPVKKSAAKSAPASNPAVPKAQIPKANDPMIDSAEQTRIFDRALGAGWRIDEVRSFLKKNFNVDSIKLIRRSQLAAILKAIETGT